jgi:hypothetical protein
MMPAAPRERSGGRYRELLATSPARQRAMQAMQLSRPRAPLTLVSLPDPEPGTREVRVRVTGAKRHAPAGPAHPQITPELSRAFGTFDAWGLGCVVRRRYFHPYRLGPGTHSRAASANARGVPGPEVS